MSILTTKIKKPTPENRQMLPEVRVTKAKINEMKISKDESSQQGAEKLQFSSKSSYNSGAAPEKTLAKLSLGADLPPEILKIYSESDIQQLIKLKREGSSEKSGHEEKDGKAKVIKEGKPRERAPLKTNVVSCILPLSDTRTGFYYEWDISDAKQIDQSITLEDINFSLESTSTVSFTFYPKGRNDQTAGRLSFELKYDPKLSGKKRHSTERCIVKITNLTDDRHNPPVLMEVSERATPYSKFCDDIPANFDEFFVSESCHTLIYIVGCSDISNSIDDFKETLLNIKDKVDAAKFAETRCQQQGDVTLKCKEVTYRIPKDYLMEESHYFEKLFNQNSGQPYPLEINFNHIHPVIFCELTQFIRTRTFSKNFKHVAHRLYIEALRYKIKPLREICERRLMHHLTVSVKANSDLDRLLTDYEKALKPEDVSRFRFDSRKIQEQLQKFLTFTCKGLNTIAPSEMELWKGYKSLKIPENQN